MASAGTHGVLLATMALLATLIPTQAGYCSYKPGGCWPSASKIKAWKKKLSPNATVLTQGEDVSYLTYVPEYNTLKSASPGLIVIPATEADVVATVKFAASARVQVLAKCSGHDFNGRSSGFGVLQLNMRNLRAAFYDPATGHITFATGVNFGDLYALASSNHRMVVGANAKTPCPVGCFLGGCHSYVSRAVGLGIDNVVSARLVLYNGTIVTASASQRPDLFNALLGAGQSSFGVVLQMTVKTQPAPPLYVKIGGKCDLLPSLSGANILSSFLLNATALTAWPTSFAGVVAISKAAANFDLLYSGEQYEGAVAFQAKIGLIPNCSLTLANYTSLSDWIETMTDATAYQRRMLASVFIPSDQAVLDALAANITAKRDSFAMSMVVSYGGAVASPVNAGAVPPGMRTALFEAVFAGAWPEPYNDDLKMASISATAKPFLDMFPHTYINKYTSFAPKYNTFPDWKTRFFNKYNDLLAVKKAYDPCNMYTVEYGLGSDLPLAACN